MYAHWKLAWILAALVIAAVTLPGPVKADDDRDEGKASVRIVVRDKDDDEDTRALGHWYGYQSNRYKDIDPETGQRIGNLLQLVTDVDRNRMTVVDRNNRRHLVTLPDRAKVIPMEGQGWGWGRDRDNNRRGPKVQVDPRFVLRPGDLVIVQGYLVADGGIWATTVRVYGRSYGWDDRYRTFHGYRAYGEVRSVDAYRMRLVVEANIGQRTVRLNTGGEVIIDGRRQSLSNVRRGDRVVFYYHDRSDDTITAYRIALLKRGDRYPMGDTPFYTDPDYRYDDDRGRGDYDSLMLEGQLDSITTGELFNILEFRASSGRRYTFRAFKSLEAIDRDGDMIPLRRLRTSDRLRIYYSETNGTLFAQRIEVL